MARSLPLGRRSGKHSRDGGDDAALVAGSPAPAPVAGPQAPPLTSKSKIDDNKIVDLKRRRDQLSARVAELQWDLGGLVYEMAIRDRIRVDVLVQRAAVLQDADAELGEVERILQARGDRHGRRLRRLRRAALHRRLVLLAVRPAAARAGPERRDLAP